MADAAEDVVLGSTQDRAPVADWALVLEAAGIAHSLRRTRHGWVLAVPGEQVDAARHEIACFEDENRDWPPSPAPAEVTTGSPPTVLLLGLLLAFYLITGPWELRSPWFAQGALSSTRVLAQGEWWRLVTALTLHADPVHLAGNLLIGGVIVHLVLRHLGSGAGLASIVLAGALGNLGNIVARGAPHLSVGFSTAVFGALGILTGLNIVRHRTLSLKTMLLPLAAALGLLGLLGSEGEHTDLGAHFFGLAVGLGLGAATGLASRLAPGILRGRRQTGLLLTTLLFLVYCWRLALRS